MLDRHALMRPLMPDRGDDRALAIGPAGAANSGRHPRLRVPPIGGNDQPRPHGRAVRQPDRPGLIAIIAINNSAAGDEAYLRRRPRRRVERPVEMMVLHHERRRLARLVVLLEPQQHRPPVLGLERRIGDRDPPHRLGMERNRLPHAERRQHAPRCRGDRRGPPVAGRIAIALRLGAVDEHRRHRRARPRPGQRQRRHEPVERAADNRYIDHVRSPRRNLYPTSAPLV